MTTHHPQKQQTRNEKTNEFVQAIIRIFLWPIPEPVLSDKLVDADDPNKQQLFNPTDLNPTQSLSFSKVTADSVDGVPTLEETNNGNLIDAKELAIQ